MDWEDTAKLPEVDLKITVREVRAEPRRLEHKDGTPILWPTCFETNCPKCRDLKEGQQLELFNE